MGKLNTVSNGKGSKPRPIKNLKQYVDNFDAIDWSIKETTQNNTHETSTNSPTTSAK